jgi:hypothetical protein
MVLVICLMLGLTNCAYAPMAVDIPLINHVDDLRIDGGINAGNALSLQSTVSLGVTDHLAAQVYTNLPFYPYSGLIYLQSSLGYYDKFLPHSVYELYAGYGVGYGNFRGSEGYPYGNGIYRMVFLQSNIGQFDMVQRSVDYAFSLKTGLMFPDFVVHDGQPFGDIIPIGPHVLIEPHIMGRFGKHRLKFHLDFGYCWLYDLKYTIEMGYQNINVSLGLNYAF